MVEGIPAGRHVDQLDEAAFQRHDPPAFRPVEIIVEGGDPPNVLLNEAARCGVVGPGRLQPDPDLERLAGTGDGHVAEDLRHRGVALAGDESREAQHAIDGELGPRGDLGCLGRDVEVRSRHGPLRDRHAEEPAERREHGRLAEPLLPTKAVTPLASWMQVGSGPKQRKFQTVSLSSFTDEPLRALIAGRACGHIRLCPQSGIIPDDGRLERRREITHDVIRVWGLG